MSPHDLRDDIEETLKKEVEDSRACFPVLALGSEHRQFIRARFLCTSTVNALQWSLMTPSDFFFEGEGQGLTV